MSYLSILRNGEIPLGGEENPDLYNRKHSAAGYSLRFPNSMRIS